MRLFCGASGLFYALPKGITAGLVPYNRAMLEFLPPRIFSAVRHVNLNRLYELRVRAEKPLSANLGGSYLFLGEGGVCSRREALVPTAREIEDALFAASGFSVYSVENQLRQGFLTGAEGERIGIAGTYVYEKGSVLAVRSVTSLCIRIPHEIHGCAEQIYRECLSEKLCSLLLLAPPGEGKTTLLRDLSRLVCERRGCNVLVCDERGELSAGDLGGTSDCMMFADKITAFTAGVRAMRPDLIVTDELLSADYAAVERAVQGGVNVFASAHLTRFEDVPRKLFSRYVLLDGLGSVGKILDEEGRERDRMPCS